MLRYCCIIVFSCYLSGCNYSIPLSQPVQTYSTLKQPVKNPSFDLNQLKGKKIILDGYISQEVQWISLPETPNYVLFLFNSGISEIHDKDNFDPLEPLLKLDRKQTKEFLKSASNYKTYRWRLEKIIGK